jgi:hypothetical protein
MPAQPREILQIDYPNPQFDRTDDWAKAIAGGTFPYGAEYEWTEVLAPSEEYDQFTLVGAAGWMINPRDSHGDLPCTHPFREFSGPDDSGLPKVDHLGCAVMRVGRFVRAGGLREDRFDHGRAPIQ